MGKSYSHKLKYRTLSQLIDAVSDDLPVLDDNNMIDPSNLIKVVTWANKMLGFRITSTKEALLDFNNYIVNLPDDLDNLNFALICTFYKNTVPAIQGDITEHEDVDCSNGCTDVWITECGDTFQITQRIYPAIENTFNIQKRVKIVDSQRKIQNDDVYGVIMNANFLKLNVCDGKIYLNYEGIMENADGELLVLDHPLVNDFYEYAVKERILENLYLRGEDVERKLALIVQRRRTAQKQAASAATLQEFTELQEVSELNRQAMFKKYFSIFI